jgi:hypothetical protein
MKHVIGLLCLSLLAMVAGQGCSRLIDEGIEKGMGPTAKVLPMDPQWPEKDQTYLESYKNFEVGTLKTEFPPVPQAFMEYLPQRLNEQLNSKNLPMDKNAKTLVINITVIAYQPVSSYHVALGPTEEVVARVELVDKASGKLVGKAVCIGRTYQSIGLGTKWKAWGLCRAIVNDWINEYYPKEGRKEAEEKAPPSE